MPPSPMRQKRAKVRERALELAERGLNRRGGPVDQGPPEQQKAAAERMRNERATNLAEMQHAKQVAGRRPAEDQVRRMVDANSAEGREAAKRHPATGGLGALSLHRNATGNERSGQLFRTIAKKGGEIHQYQSGRRVFVRKDTGGTGNRVHKAPPGSSQQMISDLARRRSTENKSRSKRSFMSYGRTDRDKGRRKGWGAYGGYRPSRWVQGPSKSQRS